MGGVLEQWTQDGHLGGLAVVTAVLALLAGLVFWATNGGADARRRKGMPPVPPGSAGWPLIGETIAHLTAAYNNRIPEFYTTRVAKYGKQQEIAKEKAGVPLTWEDTCKMKHTWHVCQETMQVQHPVPYVFWKALQDFEYKGHTIPKGWLLMWTVGRSHYSPEFFPNPEKFDPSRFEGSGPPPYTIVSFGGGPHMCLGNEFARTEIMVYLHYLVLSFEWEMEDPEEIVRNDPIPCFANNLRLKVRKKENALAL